MPAKKHVMRCAESNPDPLEDSYTIY